MNRFGLGFLFGVTVALAAAVVFMFTVVNPKTKALADTVTEQAADDQRLLEAAQDLDQRLGITVPTSDTPPAGLSQHEWNTRRVLGTISAVRVTLNLQGQNLGMFHAALSAAIDPQANQVVSAGGIRTTKGKQELAVLLDFLRPGLGRLVVPQ